MKFLNISPENPIKQYNRIHRRHLYVEEIPEVIPSWRYHQKPEGFLYGSSHDDFLKVFTGFVLKFLLRFLPRLLSEVGTCWSWDASEFFWVYSRLPRDSLSGFHFGISAIANLFPWLLLELFPGFTPWLFTGFLVVILLRVFSLIIAGLLSKLFPEIVAKFWFSI